MQVIPKTNNVHPAQESHEPERRKPACKRQLQKEKDCHRCCEGWPERLEET